MKTIWVLVADGRRARIFLADGPRGGLTELKAWTQPETGLEGKAYWSDAPGRSFDRVGEGRHAMEFPTSHKEQVKSKFARELARYLENAFHGGEFHKLVLVSEPTFLGHLRRNINNNLQHAITLEVDKDLTALPANKLRAHLPDKLASAIEL